MSEKLINEKLEGLVEIRTNDLRKSYAALEKQAITDALGGLYNRKYIIDKMDEWIENEQKKRAEIKEFGYAKTEVEKTYPSLF